MKIKVTASVYQALVDAGLLVCIQKQTISGFDCPVYGVTNDENDLIECYLIEGELIKV